MSTMLSQADLARLRSVKLPQRRGRQGYGANADDHRHVSVSVRDWSTQGAIRVEKILPLLDKAVTRHPTKGRHFLRVRL